MVHLSGRWVCHTIGLASLAIASVFYGAVADAGGILCWCKSGERGVSLGSVCKELATAGESCRMEYDVLAGFSGQFSPETIARLERGTDFGAAQACGGEGEKLECEPDVEVWAQDFQKVPGLWNLDLLDSVDDDEYKYGAHGTGVNIYVLDTGIFSQHPQFAYPADDIASGLFLSTDRRVVHGVSTIPGYVTSEDCLGHGTMVAGVAAGKTFGVAKNATLISVRTLDCEGLGSVQSIIDALDWVLINHVKPAVVQMSLATQNPKMALDLAAAKLVENGLTVVASAGNYGQDGDMCSPARDPSVISVGATDYMNRVWSFSNFGPTVTLFAPGVGVMSAYKQFAGKWLSNTADGTSLAAPHVAGAVALNLQYHPTHNKDQVLEVLMGSAKTGLLQLLPEGTPNVLLQVDPEANVGLLEVSKLNLGDAMLFKGGSFNTTVSISNVGSSDLSFTANTVYNGFIFGGWLSLSPTSGTLQPKQALNMSLSFFAGNSIWEGQYAAKVLIDSNALNNEVELSAGLLVLCSDFIGQDDTEPHEVDFPDGAVAVHDFFAPWEAANPAADGSTAFVYADVPFHFSHPVKTVPTSAVNTSLGEVVMVTEVMDRSAMCSDFTVRVKAPADVWQSVSTEICVTVLGDKVTDVYGQTFPTEQTCVVANHRPQARLFASGAMATGAAPPETDASEVTVVAVFSQQMEEPTLGLDSFGLVGPEGAELVKLKKIHPNAPYWAILLRVPEVYQGTVRLFLHHNAVEDFLGLSLMPVAPLEITWGVATLAENTGFEMRPSPSMGTIQQS